MAKDKFVTLSLLKKYDEFKCPPIQYVEDLPSDNVENGLYAIAHEGTETKELTSRFTDILSSYFTEDSKGKWTINEGYSVQVADNEPFKSCALVSDRYYIYANPDYTGMYPSSYLPQTEYLFIIVEDISHTDFYAGNAEDGSFVKLANVDEVERYFIRVDEKGRPNGVASLDVNGKVPVEQLPTEALVFKGYWKPSSGSYPADGTVAGEFYIVEEEGDFDNIHWNVNDWLIWDDVKWTRSANHNDVTSVNKKKGEVEVYGDNTEIETPTETSDKRTIKEYIDDITVDGNTWDEDTQNIESKAVLDVTELPETVSDKVYIKSTTDAEGKVTKEVYAKDTKLVTAQEDKNNIKKVNDETPDENGEVTVDGDNINVTYKEEEMTLNEALEAAGTVKTVDGIDPDDEGNIDSKAVEDVETELPETVKNKVYIVTVTDAETGETKKKVFAKSTELTTKEDFDSFVEKAVLTVDNIEPDENNNIDVIKEVTRAEYDELVRNNEDDPNVSYYIYDEVASVDLLNDYVVSEGLTWSSSKIKSVVEAATPIVFDDSKVSTTQGWTSDKIKKEIDAKSGIDDTTISTTSSWSSSKVNTEITTATTDMATQSWVTQTFEPKNTDLLTKTTADTLYQPTGDYATSDAISDMETKTHASQTYEPKNADLLTKTTADTLYEPKSAKTLATQEWVEGKGYVDKTTGDTYWQAKGSYLTESDISDMETKTHASQTYQPKGSYLTASDISDMETKTHASQTYEPKNTDLATKTWVNEQGFSKGDIPENIITQDNFLTELKKYIVRSGDVITFNL